MKNYNFLRLYGRLVGAVCSAMVLNVFLTLLTADKVCIQEPRRWILYLEVVLFSIGALMAMYVYIERLKVGFPREF